MELNHRYGCKLEMGGDDQWSNIIAGVELVRRKEAKPVYGLTFTLLTKSDGKKMGKTAGGALWLDPEKTSPYEFYQYWRNVDDADVEKCLALLTFLPMDEVKRLGAYKDQQINEAKTILAYEVTKLVHGTTRPAASVQQPAREKPAANLLRIGLWKGQSQVVVSAAAPFVLRDAATKRGLAKFKANEPVQLFVKNHQLVLNKKGISAARLELVLQSSGSDMPVTINRRHYRGSLELSLLPGGIQVVNVVPLEAYVCSVLPSEMSAGWPAEALKAQAVAARTFALHDID